MAPFLPPCNNNGVVVIGHTVQDVLQEEGGGAQVVHATVEESLGLLQQ